MTVIELTPAARDHIKLVLTRVGLSFLEIGVNGKGCNGMSYSFTPISGNNLRPADEKIDLGDGFSIIVPAECIMYLLGSTVDYENTIVQSRLIVSNPVSASTCGCGTSFSPDFSKIPNE